MIFEYGDLPSNLERHIESILYFKDFTPEFSVERVIPTGHMIIVFELDNIPRHTFENKSLKPIETFTKAWIAGTQRSGISISAHQSSEMLIIQFKPTGFYPFFHFPVQDVNKRLVSAEEIFGKEIVEVRSQILMAQSLQEKFEITVRWLNYRYNPQREVPEYLMLFVERLKKEAVSNIHEIIASYPFTHKQLIVHFRKYIGVTPKYYCRILRFNETLRIINRKEKLSWTNIAYSCDYSDQSHFIKEFYFFSGFNPQEFAKMNSIRTLKVSFTTGLNVIERELLHFYSQGLSENEVIEHMKMSRKMVLFHKDCLLRRFEVADSDKLLTRLSDLGLFCTQTYKEIVIKKSM